MCLTVQRDVRCKEKENLRIVPEVGTWATWDSRWTSVDVSKKRRSMSSPSWILCNQRQCALIVAKQSESMVKPLHSKITTNKLPPATDWPTIEDPSSNLEMVKRKNVEGEAYNKQTHQSATTLRAGFLYLHPGCKSAVDFDRHATKGTEEVRRNA